MTDPRAGRGRQQNRSSRSRAGRDSTVDAARLAAYDVLAAVRPVVTLGTDNGHGLAAILDGPRLRQCGASGREFQSLVNRVLTSGAL